MNYLEQRSLMGVGDIDDLLGQFEKWALDRVGAKKSPSYAEIVEWFTSRSVILNAVEAAFLKTVHSEGFVSSNYADDEPTRYGIILTTWNSFAKKTGGRQYTEKEFLKGGAKGPLSLKEAFQFYKSLAGQVPIVSDPVAVSLLMDVAWAGSAHPDRLRTSLIDAGLNVSSQKGKWTDDDVKLLNGLSPKALRALLLSARLDTYMTSNKSYGALVAKGTLEDKYYLGILRRLINKKFLGDDFSFVAFPRLSGRLKELNNKGTGIKFNDESSWHNHFFVKNWPGPSGVLSNLTPDQRAQILNA